MPYFKLYNEWPRFWVVDQHFRRTEISTNIISSRRRKWWCRDIFHIKVTQEIHTSIFNTSSSLLLILHFNVKIFLQKPYFTVRLKIFHFEYMVWIFLGHDFWIFCYLLTIDIAPISKWQIVALDFRDMNLQTGENL